MFYSKPSNRKNKTSRLKSNSDRRSRLGFEALEERRVLASVISEVHIEPLFGNHDTEQYVELRGTPNTTLPTGSYFVLLEGWGAVPGGPGYVHSVIDLSGLTYGANGFLVLAQSGTPYSFSPDATTVISNATGFSGLPNNRWSDASTLSDRLAFIFNSGTFMLIQSAQKPVPASDADANDDGVFDGAAASWNVIDSVGLLNNTAGESRSYGKITFSEDPSYFYPSGTVLVDTDGSGYVGRIGASTGWAANDWVSGTTQDKDSATPLLYEFTFGTFGDPRPLVYSGRPLDHVGTYNFNGGVRGSVASDTNGDGIITGADSPLPGVNVFADQNGNGVRDNISTLILSTNYANGTDLTNRFPNATLTVADRNNENIGFVVRTQFWANLNSLSSEGIHWFDDSDRLKIMFYQEANAVSVQAIGAETLRDSYGRMELYDKNDQLLEAIQTGPMRSPQRAILSASRPQADIKYAIIYTNENFANSSPFGRFDSLIYSYPEFTSVSNSLGEFAIEELPKGSYNIIALGGPAGKIPIGSPTYGLSVTLSEHLQSADFGFRDNLPPVISTTNLTIAENPTIGDIVGQIVATDPDPGQSVTYEFLTAAGPFAVDLNTGVVRVANGSGWDFESTTPIVVEVKVTDSFESPSNSKRFVTLTPSDINEPPVVNAQEFTVPENSVIGTVVGKVLASDPDAGNAGTLQYTITAGGPTSTFSIDPLTGTITLLANSLDFETKPTWSVPITVKDQGVPSRSTNRTITVRVSNVNEAPTGISFSNVAQPPETTNASTPIFVANIGITDDALGTNALSITGPDASFFSIVSGQLRFQTANKLDFETKPTYSIIVQLDDPTVGATPDVTSNFTLTLSDVNEAPTGLQLVNPVLSLPESTSVAAGVRVATLQVTDDALGNNSVSLSGADANKFVIVGQELRLRSSTPLDFETKSSYQVTVSVDDPTIGSTPDATATLSITIADVNEPPTQIQLDELNALVLESSTPSTDVALADLSFTDDALGVNTYALIGTDADKFVVVGNQLRVKPGTIFDYETKATYDVTVRIEDAELVGASFPIASFQMSIGNRPEVVSVTDLNGAPLGTQIKSARVNWDSATNISNGAIKWKKTDVGGADVPLTFSRFTINGKTFAELEFSGPYTDANGLLEGTYSLEVDGSLVLTTSGVEGVSYIANDIPVVSQPLPGNIVLDGPTWIQSTTPFGLQISLTGLASPPAGAIEYRVDFNGDGTTDRTENGNLTHTLANASFSAAGSFTILVTAIHNGVVLGKGAKVIDVSPTTTLTEDWLNSLDSDRDNSISPLDVLLIINRINSKTEAGGVPYNLNCDVDRDGSVSPLDVLSIINYINQDPTSRRDTFSALNMTSSGGIRGITNDMSLSGQIAGEARNLVVMLDGTTKKDASQFVQSDGSFSINDAAIIQLFGSIADGPHTLSLATRTGNNYSFASDKRFFRMTSQLKDFTPVSVVPVGNDIRIQWSSSASGARYNVYVAPKGLTPEKVGSTTASQQALLTLTPGEYDYFIEAIDGAGNKKRTSTMSFRR